MPQSLSKIYVHIIFSTKYRNRLIVDDNIRKELHSFIVSVLAKTGSYTEELYANDDHIHILCTLPRTITVAQLISKIKTTSSKWLKAKGIENFTWQGGYAVFSVSSSIVDIVSKYILKQPEHHKKRCFQNEVREFFNEYDVEYDERYVWD